LSNSSRESNNIGSVSTEEVLNVRSEGIRSRSENNVVLLLGAQSIIVEVINYERVSVCREMDVELQEE
jgi:hypothetical protein